MDEENLTQVRRGEITTLSIPVGLKKRIDEIKSEKTTYAELLADFFRPEVINRLEELRAEGETYGDVILLLTAPSDRDPEETEALIQSALGRSTVVDERTTEVRFDDG